MLRCEDRVRWHKKTVHKDPNYRRLFACPGNRSAGGRFYCQGTLAELVHISRARAVPSAIDYFSAYFIDGGCPLVCHDPLYELLPAIRHLILFCSFLQRRPVAGPGSADFLVLPYRPLIIS